MFVLNKSAIVQELTASGIYVTHHGYPNPIKCDLQPASAELVMMGDSQFFKSYSARAELTSSGIMDNNRLIIDNLTYTVIGRQVYSVPIGLTHVTFSLERALP